MSKEPLKKRLARWLWPDIFESYIDLERRKRASDDGFWTRNKDFNDVSIKMMELTTQNDKLKQQLADLRPTVEAELKASLAEQNKPKWRENCVFAFEKDGHQYHRFRSAVDLPLNRMERLQLWLMNQGHKLSPENLETLLDVIDTSLSSAMNATKPEDRVKYLKNALWAIQEIKHRKDKKIFSTYTLAEAFSILIVRDDERVEVIDEVIAQEKVDGFHQWGGDVDFFTKTGLHLLIPLPEQLLEKSNRQWESLWANLKEMERDETETYQNFLASRTSTNTGKTSQKT